VVREPALWWCVAALPVMAALNLGASFYLAFLLALRAHNVTGVDRARIQRVIWQRWRSAPLSFFWPTPQPLLPPAKGADSGG
jgi:site-specific recombinase